MLELKFAIYLRAAEVCPHRLVESFPWYIGSKAPVSPWQQWLKNH